MAAGFGLDEDEPETEADYRKRVMQEAERTRKDKQTQQELANILAEDPTAFDFDGVYDEMKQARGGGAGGARGGSSNKPKESKYIDQLMEKAREREKQRDLVWEKKLQREVEAEKHIYGETEEFITSAYKKKLEENRKFEEERKKKEEEAARREVSGKKDLSAFYTNLLTTNVAFGNEAPKPEPQKPSSSSDTTRDRSRSPSPRRNRRSPSPRGGYRRSRSPQPRDRYRRSRSPPRRSRRSTSPNRCAGLFVITL
jgi:coiled-coil domain-containing protein 55